MTWVIVHRSPLVPSLPPMYWTGEPFDGRHEVYVADPVNAALFRTEEAAAEAWWGPTHRPTDKTCCNPEAFARVVAG